jgi:hypothetical protein
MATEDSPSDLVGLQVRARVLTLAAIAVARPDRFVEYRGNPHAVAYLQSLRVPVLTLMPTHLDTACRIIHA